MKFEFLKSKEIKELKNKIDKQFGVVPELDYIFLKNTQDRIFAVSKKLKEFDIGNLRVNRVGLYFGKVEDGLLRLTIEGVQLIKPNDNVLEINEEQLKDWVKGQNLVMNSDLRGVAIIKFENDYLGCAKIGKGIVYNFIPKERRLKGEIL